MQVNLCQEEINILEQALDTWEKDASTSGLFGMMVGALFCSKEERDNEKERQAIELAKGQAEGLRRKRVSTLLRAKLYQADAHMSEHNV